MMSNPNGGAMPANEGLMRRAAELARVKPGTLWHRERGGTQWVNLGDFPSVIAAAIEMEARRAKGETGDWKAMVAGRDPDAKDEDDGGE